MVKLRSSFLVGWGVVLAILGLAAIEVSTLPSVEILPRYSSAWAIPDTVTYGDLRIVYTVDVDTATNAAGQLRYILDLSDAPAGARMSVLMKPDKDSAMLVTTDTFAMSPTDSATALARSSSWGVPDPSTVSLDWWEFRVPDPITGFTLVMANDTLVADWTESSDDYQITGGLNSEDTTENYTDTTTAPPNKHVVVAFGSYWSCVRAFNAVGLSDSRCTSVAYDEPPAPPSGAYPNEPALFDSITGRPFLSRDEDGWVNESAGNFRVFDGATYNPVGANSPGAPPFAPTDSWIGEARYTTGLPGGSGPILVWKLVPPDSAYTELYVSWHFQVSSNYEMPSGGSLITKMFFIQLCDPNGFNCKSALIPNMRGSTLPPYKLSFSTQSTADDPDGAQSFTSGNAVIVPGEWQHIEMYLKLNSVQGNDDPNPDGIAKLWVDGVLVINASNLTYRGNGPVSQIDADFLFSGEIRWNPTWPGPGSPTVNMYTWMAHWYASGK